MRHRSVVPAFCFFLGGLAAGQQPQDRCRDAHRSPTCASYVLVEATGMVRLAGTQADPPAGCTPVASNACNRKDLQSYLVIDAGLMTNRDSSHATGFSVQMGGSDDGARFAALLRQRWWLDAGRVMDFAIGPIAAQRRVSSASGSETVFGATAQLGYGRARLGTIRLGADVAPSSGRFATGIHAGISTESRGLWMVPLTALIGGVILASAISAGGR